MGEQPVRTTSTAGGIPGDAPAHLSQAVAELMAATEDRQLCAHGWHAWVPWLRLDNGSSITWCVREGCDHHEQYDPGASVSAPEETDQ